MDIYKFNFKNSPKILNIYNNNVKLRKSLKLSVKNQTISNLCDMEIELLTLDLDYSISMPVLKKYLEERFENWYVLLLDQLFHNQTKKVELLKKIYEFVKNDVKNEIVTNPHILSEHYNYENLKHNYNRKLVNAYDRLNDLKQEIDYEMR
jgi:hypothetical protein